MREKQLQLKMELNPTSINIETSLEDRLNLFCELEGMTRDEAIATALHHFLEQQKSPYSFGKHYGVYYQDPCGDDNLVFMSDEAVEVVGYCDRRILSEANRALGKKGFVRCCLIIERISIYESRIVSLEGLRRATEQSSLLDLLNPDLYKLS